jgi:hypothetical protein
MDPIYTFGFALSKLTHQKEFTGIGLLCLAIKDSGRGYKNLDYEDFKDVFEAYLPKRLEKAQLANPRQVADEMMKMLKESQSIFTVASYHRASDDVHALDDQHPAASSFTGR